MTNHVIFITGLGSSLPFIGCIWTAWARKLEKRFRKHYGRRADTQYTRVSSDGKGEQKALDILRRARDRKMLGKVCIIGHSNGFRDGLLIAADIRAKVDYFAGIDMTLDDDDVEVPANVRLFHEFHAILKKAVLSKGFKSQGRDWEFWQINKGPVMPHTRAASDKFVQGMIFKTITGIIK